MRPRKRQQYADSQHHRSSPPYVHRSASSLTLLTLARSAKTQARNSTKAASPTPAWLAITMFAVRREPRPSIGAMRPVNIAAARPPNSSTTSSTGRAGGASPVVSHRQGSRGRHAVPESGVVDCRCEHSRQEEHRAVLDRGAGFVSQGAGRREERRLSRLRTAPAEAAAADCQEPHDRVLRK